VARVEEGSKGRRTITATAISHSRRRQALKAVQAELAQTTQHRPDVAGAQAALDLHQLVPALR
jgi:hypothetical protein